jgi:hypothetical protein
MKNRMKNFTSIVLTAIALSVFSFHGLSQETFYGIETNKELKTTDTEDLHRPGSCWANAGTAFLEAEWLRLNNTEMDISTLAFIRNAYLLKAQAYLNSDGRVRVDEKGIAFDVVALTAEYGLVPSDAFYKSDEKPMDARSGEMDAILRGTLQMVIERENGVFSDRWRNTYEAALTRYIGYSRQQFTVNGNEHSAKSFLSESGIEPSDYILIASDSRAEMNKLVDFEVRNNWNNNKAFNVETEKLPGLLKEAVTAGYPVLFYGSLDADMIFEAEQVGLVPAGSIADLTTAAEGQEISYEPLPERAITPEDQQRKLESNLGKNLDYLLIFGISTDKEGNEYLMAKKLCEAGDQTLNLSASFVKLNMVYLMINKEGLPKAIKSQLKF